jgi:hypothetical protein
LKIYELKCKVIQLKLAHDIWRFRVCDGSWRFIMATYY